MSGKKGYNQLLLFTIMAVMIGLLVLTVMGKQFVNLTEDDIIKVTEKRARAIENILVLEGTMQQGVRQYELYKSYNIKLNQTHIELTYAGETKTMADDTLPVIKFALMHNQNNVVNAEIIKPARICISKRIIDCTPVTTICEAGAACCTIQSNKCKYVT